MNRNGNTYTFLYAAIMVILVAAVLASVSMALQPRQKRNFEIDKKKNILASVNIESDATNAEKIYADKILNEYVVNVNGEQVDGDAFNTDLKKERAKDASEMVLPIFEFQTDEGLKYVLPLRGAGLWGPVWGFVALNEDMSTIYGANFDHEGETPGLGAEISTAAFESAFVGKQIFDASGKLVSILVAKIGQVAPEEHKVDGISGGTITSKGLEKMLLDDFTSYQEFLKKKKQ
ncbi:MAG: NADH:ubiquinone reductase (Na(+)-transporting) subunit C [Prolixibacteraceae bacterium]|nr:NADH:ubiquinone reductase (Na(+)-transporting) subunit C [Prolixibacteraceae bacterium]MBT6996891.1 NADH:ubiquinone reductase (Na(+)-transporting) subunit C [Prolixibacteraceae bacterium]MBT7393758.1 NADH:ubiquinone reductase (Na(+)-transporting) subunit C [Prolixibacteraceae bacterium]